MRNVNTSGSITNNNANNSNGAAPDCANCRLRVNLHGRNQGATDKELLTSPERANQRALMRVAPLSKSRYPNAARVSEWTK